MDLALNLMSKIPANKLSTDARLLLVTDGVKRHQAARALQWLNTGPSNADLTFLAPLLNAWDFSGARRSEQGDFEPRPNPASSLLGPLRDEEQALILLKFKRTRRPSLMRGGRSVSLALVKRTCASPWPMVSWRRATAHELPRWSMG